MKNGFWKELDKLKAPALAKLVKKSKWLALRSKASSTSAKYTGAFARWKAWAKSAGLNDFPASGLHVGIYLAHLIEKSNSQSVVNSAIYGIKWAHRMCAFPDPTNHPFPKMMAEASKRELGKPVVPKKAADGAMLIKLCQEFGGQEASLKDLRFLSMSLLSYAGFLRFNEVVNIRRNYINIEEDHITLFIKESKNDVYKEGSSVAIGKGKSTACPITYLTRYLSAVNLLSDSTKDVFIFRRLRYSKKKLVLSKNENPISYSSSRKELLNYVERIGLDPTLYGWHSFRSGGATAAAKGGVNDRLFKKHGRWRSDSAKDGYVREDLKTKLTVTASLDI